jgi:hypothetical protein
LEDELIQCLVDLHVQALEKKDLIVADQIKEKLRAIGVVLLPRRDSDIFWNINGLIQNQ